MLVVSTAYSPVSAPSASNEVQPLRAPLHLDEVDSVAVSPRLFNQLAKGQLSAVVLPDVVRTPEGMHLQIVNSKEPHKTLSLEIGRSLLAQGEPGLRPGFKAVSLHLPAGRKFNADDVQVTQRPSFALSEAHMRGRSFYVKYALGSIHGEPMRDGGTIHMHEGADVKLTRVASMMHGDMPGIAPGYEMITLPQRQRVQLG